MTTSIPRSTTSLPRSGNSAKTNTTPSRKLPLNHGSPATAATAAAKPCSNASTPTCTTSSPKLRREAYFIQHEITGEYLCGIENGKPQWTANPYLGFPFCTMETISANIRQIWDLYNEPHARVSAVMFWADPAHPNLWHIG